MTDVNRSPGANYRRLDDERIVMTIATSEQAWRLGEITAPAEG